MACFYSICIRPVCQTVSYAAVKSRKMAPVFRFCWNPFFDESGEGSNLVTSASTFPETSLVWTE